MGREGDGVSVSPQAAPFVVPQSEEAFCDTIIELAQLLGYLAFHPRPARTEKGWRTAFTGNSGYPDLTLVHRETGAVVFAELKVGRNVPRPDQQEWLDALANGASWDEHGVRAPRVYVWRPGGWDQVESVLKTGARRA